MPSRRSSTLFSLDPVPEIHLARAPLEKVLTQVQFSLTPGLVSEAGEEGLAAERVAVPHLARAGRRVDDDGDRAAEDGAGAV